MPRECKGVDVCVSHDALQSAPCCSHGPTLLFERYVTKSTPRRFYACSACRDRKDCPFFRWADKGPRGKMVKRKVEDERHRKQQLELHNSHQISFQRLKELRVVKPSQRSFCLTCGLLLLETDITGHTGHNVISPISKQQLRCPSHLLPSLSCNKSNAQYLFSESTIEFLVNLLIRLQKSKVLCIGTPRLFEAILTHNRKHKSLGIQVDSILLDIDHRIEQFFGPQKFCRYNMFNHYFFAGDKSKSVYLKFLKSCRSPDDLLIVVDPPFGGLIDVLAYTMHCIKSDFTSVHEDGFVPESSRKRPPPVTSGSVLPTIWFFPYFMEPRVCSVLPSFVMLDYQVTYDNHGSFSASDVSRKQSPVRMFTNISPSLITLPEKDKYWFCEACQRYSAPTNKHCGICHSCTTKAGPTYVHCRICGRCVKPSWSHCEQCRTCELPGRHSLVRKSMAGCHICGVVGHRRQQCPNRDDIFTSDPLPKTSIKCHKRKRNQSVRTKDTSSNKRVCR